MYCDGSRLLGFANELIVSVRHVAEGQWTVAAPVESSGVGVAYGGDWRAFWSFLNFFAHARLSCAMELINGFTTALLVYALSIDDAIMFQALSRCCCC
jgi:hypothetical protein